VYAALTGNLLVAVTKTIAAFISGSSAMLSEAVHSAVDSIDQMLLLYGMRRARRPAHEAHPLGHGREIYFWSFVVALLIFSLGAGISIYEGILHLHHPEPIHKPLVNYAVLALAFLFEGWSWTIARREFDRQRGPRGFFEEFRRSKDPPAFLVLFEDSAALLGIAIAAVATVLATRFGVERADGIASILIGLILGAIAILLAQESKSLLIGEQADPALREAIVRIAKEVSAVEEVSVVLAVQLSPDQIVVALQLQFPDHFRSPEIAQQIKQIERQVKVKYPEVLAVFVRPRD